MSRTNLIYLLGNKIDLNSKIEVKEKKVKIFVDSNNIKYFPISVKNDINIKEFLSDLKTNLDIDRVHSIKFIINFILQISILYIIMV